MVLVGTLACFGSLSSPAQTPIPTIPPISTPGIPFVEGWDGTTFETVCLDESLTYPDGIQQNLKISIREALETMGFRVAVVGNTCDATLTLALTGEPLADFYNDLSVSSKCYSGAKYDGKVILSSPDHTSLIYPIYVKVDPPGAVTIEECKHYPQDAPFFKAYHPAILNVLEHLWGPPGLVSLLGNGIIGVDEKIEFELIPMKMRRSDFTTSNEFNTAVCQAIESRFKFLLKHVAPSSEIDNLVQDVEPNLHIFYMQMGRAVDKKVLSYL